MSWYFFINPYKRDLDRSEIVHASFMLPDVAVINFSDHVLDSAREKPGRPAYIKLAVPDAVVKNFRGSSDQRDTFCLVVLPKNVKERSQSRIILPGEIVR